MKIKINLLIFLIGTVLLLNNCRKSDYIIDEESVTRETDNIFIDVPAEADH